MSTKKTEQFHYLCGYKSDIGLAGGDPMSLSAIRDFVKDSLDGDDNGAVMVVYKLVPVEEHTVHSQVTIKKLTDKRK